jgi:hypothetical protein
MSTVVLTLDTDKFLSLKTLRFPLIGPLNFELVLQNAVPVLCQFMEIMIGRVILSDKGAFHSRIHRYLALLL